MQVNRIDYQSPTDKEPTRIYLCDDCKRDLIWSHIVRSSKCYGACDNGCEV